MVAAPFVRGAYAAGKLAVGLWDHWVPGANKGAEAVARAWAEKEKVDLQIDFITSQGNKLLLTVVSEAQAKSGHDVIFLPAWLTSNSTCSAFEIRWFVSSPRSTASLVISRPASESRRIREWSRTISA